MTNTWTHPLMAGLPKLGGDIERRSHEIIADQLRDKDIDPAHWPVVRRMVHATADVSFAETVRIHPQAIEAGLAALAQGKCIICDVHMLQMGITRTDSDVLCAIRDPDVIAVAKAAGTTRAVAAMEHFADQLDGSIVAIGNAPTALWKIIELAATRNIRPALIVGLPVGFVGAAESKQALLESDLCYITNVGPRGGSPVAAAAVNAIATLAKDQ